MVSFKHAKTKSLVPSIRCWTMPSFSTTLPEIVSQRATSSGDYERDVYHCWCTIAACCPGGGGDWACRAGQDQDYECPFSEIVGKEQGNIWGEDDVYERPPWWDVISDQYDDLKECSQRPLSPTSGARCGPKPKKCFWGDRKGCVVDDVAVESYPEVMCECQGASPGVKGSWVCSDVQCLAATDGGGDGF